MSPYTITMRPCDAPCGLWAGCADADCAECPLPVIVPGEPGRDEDDTDVLTAPDPEMRVSDR